jgi:hypothetical protein
VVEHRLDRNSLRRARRQSRDGFEAGRDVPGDQGQGGAGFGWRQGRRAGRAREQVLAQQGSSASTGNLLVPFAQRRDANRDHVESM